MEAHKQQGSIQTEKTLGGGTMHVTAHPDGVVISRMKGYLAGGIEWTLLDPLETLILRGQKVSVFCDWEEMTDFDAAIRVTFTDWAKRRRESVKSIDCLVKSRLVAVGVSTAGVMLGLAGLKVTAFTDRASFEQRIAAAHRDAAGPDRVARQREPAKRGQ